MWRIKRQKPTVNGIDGTFRSAAVAFGLAVVMALLARPLPAGEPAAGLGSEGAAKPRFGFVTDIEGNRYRTVIIGKQEWMVENLRTTRFNDGTPMPQVRDDAEWGSLTSPALAWYENKPGDGNGYGVLYNWYAVGTGRLLGPKGWRVPSHEDWTVFLTQVMGGESVTGGQVLMRGELKSRRTEPDGHPRWNVPNTAATDETGFGALPGGHRSHLGVFNYQGQYGFWWSATSGPSNFGWYRGMRYDNGHVFMASGNKKNGFSVRCVRDLP